eukprot:9139411-Pyramimonas_sp.AAC.1
MKEAKLGPTAASYMRGQKLSSTLEALFPELGLGVPNGGQEGAPSEMLEPWRPWEALQERRFST